MAPGLRRLRAGQPLLWRQLLVPRRGSGRGFRPSGASPQAAATQYETKATRGMTEALPEDETQYTSEV